MRVKINPGVLFQELDNEAVLLNLNNEEYHGLNEVGSRTWQLLAEYGETGEVIAALLAEYNIDATTLRQDVENLVIDLAGRNLVVIETQ